MRKWSRLLPADTRAVELASAAAMLFCANLMFVGGVTMPDHPGEVWAVMLACFGLLQGAGAVKEAGALRTVANFVAGSWWVWAGLTSDGVHVEPGDFAAVAVGLSCFYAFVLHGSAVAGGDDA